MSNTAIEISHLTVGYGRSEVLTDVSLSIQYQSVMAVVGANGAGKSTLLRAVAGDLVPTAGSVVVDGKSIGEYSPRERARRIAFVEQNIAETSMTVGEYVMLGRMPHRSLLSVRDSRHDREMVRNAVSIVGINDLIDKQLNCISGGERQLASVARVIAQQSPVLLLDEPTSNLDIANQQRILSIVRRLAESEQKAVIIVVHDINQAVAVADEVAILKCGRLLAHGSAQQCITQDVLQNAYDTDVCIVRDDASQRIVVIPNIERKVSL